MDKFTKRLLFLRSRNYFPKNMKEIKKYILLIKVFSLFIVISAPTVFLINVFLLKEINDIIILFLGIFISISFFIILFMTLIEFNNKDLSKDLTQHIFYSIKVLKKQIKYIKSFKSIKKIKRYFKSMTILEENNIELNKKVIIEFENNLDIYLDNIKKAEILKKNKLNKVNDIKKAKFKANFINKVV